MSSCIARQPIFNKKLNVYGYELLFRESSEHTSFTGTDGDKASTETISNAFHEIGIEQVTGGKRAFVNFTERLLLDRIATLFSNKLLVVEVLEDVFPTPAVLKACASLKRKGYQIAVDDFSISPEYLPLLDYADIVKVDFLNTEPAIIESFAHSMKHKPIYLLAEKLETNEMFEYAKSLGFSLFQGYFFSKPVVMTTAPKLVPVMLNCISLIRLAMSENVNYTQIENIIKKDVALAYRLLRVVNSAFYGLPYTVKNVRQALAILGMSEVRKWITLISLSEIRENKPDELIRMALIRARFLELIASKAGLRSSEEDLFMIGLMSLMEAIMDMSMEAIIEQTNLSPNITQPLITREGPLGRLLQLVTDFEASRFDEALAIAKDFRLSEETVSKTFLEAITWATSIMF